LGALALQHPPVDKIGDNSPIDSVKIPQLEILAESDCERIFNCFSKQLVPNFDFFIKI
jgi:hypothetical protein